jgi:hypothetical protein
MTFSRPYDAKRNRYLYQREFGVTFPDPPSCLLGECLEQYGRKDGVERPVSLRQSSYSTITRPHLAHQLQLLNLCPHRCGVGAHE